MDGLGGSKENLRVRVGKVPAKEIIVVCYKSLYGMELVVFVISKRLG